MMNEIWKQCEENPKWEISSYGNLRNIAKQTKPYRHLHKQGYWYAQYKSKGKAKSVKVHRLVAKAFLANPLNKRCVNHKDAVKTNNHVDNLEWVTHLENSQHAYANNLVPALIGELNGRALINEELVHKICRAYVDGMSPKSVIDIFGVTRNQAIKIKCKTTWKHITTQYIY
jgi:hypothetical protein